MHSCKVLSAPIPKPISAFTQVFPAGTRSATSDSDTDVHISLMISLVADIARVSVSTGVLLDTKSVRRLTNNDALHEWCFFAQPRRRGEAIKGIEHSPTNGNSHEECQMV